MKKTMSAAGARAPWLKLVGDKPASDASDSTSASDPVVIASRPKRFIDPHGKHQSFALRLVTWKQDNGNWAFGVMKEAWAGEYMQGTPTDLKLWKCPQEFSDRSRADEVREFYYVNKTIALIEHELLGERSYFEEQAAGFVKPAVPPIVGEFKDGRVVTPLPFGKWPEISGRAKPQNFRLNFDS